MRTNKPEVVRQSLLWIQVCVPKTYTDKQVEDFANGINPTGISSGWTICRDEPVRCQCVERGDCEHLVLNC